MYLLYVLKANEDIGLVSGDKFEIDLKDYKKQILFSEDHQAELSLSRVI